MAFTHLQKRTILRSFSPFNRLDDKSLVLLDEQIEVESYQPKDIVFNQGASVSKVFFFISGCVKAKTVDGDSKVLHHYDPNVEEVFVHADRYVFTVVAETECLFLVMEKHDFENMCSALQPTKETSNVISFGQRRSEVQLSDDTKLDRNNSSAEELNEVEMVLGNEETEKEKETSNIVSLPDHQVGAEPTMQQRVVLEQINDDILQGDLRLPSIPEVAMKVRHAVNDPESDIKSIASIASQDPVISLKLVEASNSPLYKCSGKSKSVFDAVNRLGKDTTRQLVTIFAVRELFNHRNEQALAALRDIWKNSVEVASLNYIIAKQSSMNYDPEVAMMAGLIYRIGEIPILTYSANYPELADQYESIERIAWVHARNVGCQIMSAWQMDQLFIDVIRHATHWDFLCKKEQDYAALTIVSQAIIAHVAEANGTPSKRQRFYSTPELDNLPALHMIGLDEASSEAIEQMLFDAAGDIEEMRNMLN